jgi:hypothetical protein
MIGFLTRNSNNIEKIREEYLEETRDLEDSENNLFSTQPRQFYP